MSKSRIFIIFSLVLFAVILSGCGKEVKVLPPLDKKTAVEECAQLIIPSGAKVKRIDGEKRSFFRSWRTGAWSWKSKAATLLIPAGEHTITSDFSHPLDGWLGKNLDETAEMSAGKMYMLSVTIAEDEKVGTGYSVLNIAGSFVRDYVVQALSLIKFLPRSNPNGIVYQIDEIDQEAFDEYLLEAGASGLSRGTYYKAVLAAILWYGVSLGVIRILFYYIFMGKFLNRHKFFAIFFSVILVGAGLAAINYNSSGILSLYATASILIGIGISGWDYGRDANKKGLEKLSKNDYAGAISQFNSAIMLAPYNALYLNNRGVAYTYMQEWKAALADFTKAVQYRPKNPLYRKNLTDTQALVKLG